MKKINKYPWEKYYIDMPKIKYEDISMYEQVKKTCIANPKLCAYEYYGTKVSYKRMLNKIDEIASSFLRLGVKKSDVVTICMPNTPEGILSFYALNKIGAVCNMVHPLSSEEELKYAINNSKSKYLLIIDLAFGKYNSIKDKISLDKIIWCSVSESMDTTIKFGYFFTKGIKIATPYGNNVISWREFNLLSSINYKDVDYTMSSKDDAVILYSGGTTGKQKGIVLTNNNFNSLVLSELSINKTLGVGMSMLAIMPIFHGFGLGCTFHAIFSSGAKAIILPQVNPKTFDDTIIKYKPNIIACVPSILESLTYSPKLKDYDLSFIKCIVCGGDSLTYSLEKRINDFLNERKSDCKVRTAFGLTEATAGVTMMPYETSRKESIGIPIPDTVIKICECGTIKEVPVGNEGEICVCGPTVMKCYLNEEKETKNVLIKHSDDKVYLHTGDMGYIDEDGFIYFKARIKRMIVSSGYNIYPSTIEEVIMSSPYVKECVVVGKPHPYKKEVAKAYIVLKDEYTLNKDIKNSIRELCKKNISSYALPYAYGYRKELPKTKIGKIAYKDIKDEDDFEEDDLHVKAGN